MDPDVLLDVDGLAVAYRDAPGNEVRLVDDVSFTLKRGEALGLAGESGCGKTTTALSILGLLPGNLYRAAGEITLNSDRGIMHIDRRTDRGFRDLRWRNVSIVFQGAMNALDPVMRVSKQIGEALDAARARHGRRRGGRAHRRSCSATWASARTAPASTRTSSPAACDSA